MVFDDDDDDDLLVVGPADKTIGALFFSFG